MEDKDGGQRTTALVTSLGRAVWIWRWFVQPAIVWFGGGLDGADPNIDIPLHRALTPVELAGPRVCGGGTTANVGEATCAIGWFQCCGSGTKRGTTRVQIRTAGGMGARKAKEGAMQGRRKLDARAPHRRCAEDAVGLSLAATRIRSCRVVEREEGGREQSACAV